MPEKTRLSLPEHAPANRAITSGENGGHTPEKEMEDIKLVLGLLEKGKAYKSTITEDWDERWKFYNDEQWGSKRPSYKSSPVMNIIKITIQSMLPILTDARPGFNVLPEEPTDFPFAEILSEATQSWWDRSGMDHTLIEVLMDSFIYDAGIMKVAWNQDLLEGIGDIDCKIIDPRNIYIPYEARDFDKECGWVIETMDKTVGELKRKFPDKAKIIVSDETYKNGDKDMEESMKDTKVHLQSPIDKNDPTSEKPASGRKDDDRKTCKVAECWIDDDSLVEFFEEDEEGNKVRKYKKRFPKGKLVIILVNQKRVLWSDGNPYKHGKKPYIRFVDTILPRRFWGDGEVKPLMEIQKCINKTLANIIDYMNLMGNPIWKNEKGSGVDSNKLRNSIGLILEPNKNMSNSVTREIAPPLPEYVMELYNLLQRAAEQISGSSEITQGRRPKGVSAAAAIEAIQEAANTRIRLKERNMQVSLSQLGEMVIQLMMQFYTEPRMTRITGKEGWPEFFEFFVEPIDDRVVYSKRKYGFDEGRRQYEPLEDFQQGSPSKGIFDVKVMAGTAVPHEKAQRVNVAFRLFEQGVIDDEELLETLEWPNKEEIIKRMQEKREQAAAMAAQQQGQM